MSARIVEHVDLDVEGREIRGSDGIALSEGRGEGRGEGGAGGDGCKGDWTAGSVRMERGGE